MNDLKNKNYKELNLEANKDRETNIDPANVFKEEFAAESAEGLGGSSRKLGNNIINKEQYFREKSKQTINKEYFENLLEELNL